MIDKKIDYKEPSHHLDLALMLADTLDSLEINSQELFANCGVDLLDYNATNDRIGAVALQCLWSQAVTVCGRDDLGIICAKHLKPISMHGLLVSAAASDTMMDAHKRLLKHYRVVTTLGKVSIRKLGNEVRFSFKLPFPVGTAVIESVDSIFAGLWSFCQFASNGKMTAERVELQRRRPELLETFESFFNCPIEFDCQENALFVSYQQMQQRLPGANPEVARANEQVVVDYLRRFDDVYLANRATSFIIEELPTGIPTQSRIAKLLGLSGRTLRRKLSNEGLTYVELLEQTQQFLSTQYLASTTLNIGAISYLVGYSEPSNFIRSFKKWTKQTPNEFRVKCANPDVWQ